MLATGQATYQLHLATVPRDEQVTECVFFTFTDARGTTWSPGGALYFPQLANSTGELTLPEWVPASNRGLMMPTRRRTREQDRAYRIWLERSHNEERMATAEQARRTAATKDPPPF